MLIGKLLSTRKTDAQLPDEIRASLVASLFGSLSSLAMGAIACSIIGAAAAVAAGDPWILACSVAIFAVGMVRVACAVVYKRTKRSIEPGPTRRWEFVYELGAWVFSSLLGLLCVLTLLRTDDLTLHLMVSTTAAGYAAAIAGRNAGRPIIAVGQLALTALPLSLALFIHGGLAYYALGFVILLFVYGMVDITMSIREIILQALTMTRREAALAARFEEQANRFDIALNNMSHGLIMFDGDLRVLVANRTAKTLFDVPPHINLEGRSFESILRYGRQRKVLSARQVDKLKRQLVPMILEGGSNKRFVLNDGRHVEFKSNPRAFSGAVLTFEDVTERINAEKQMVNMARYDALTGLPNRGYFATLIGERLKQMNDDKDCLLIMLDVDDFKHVNDTLGHSQGDALLRAVANRLKDFRTRDIMISRQGGDEFMIFVPEMQEGEAPSRIAEILRSTLTGVYELSGEQVHVTVSIGVATSDREGFDLTRMMVKADLALYRSKALGKGAWSVFEDSMDAEYKRRQMVKNELAKALDGRKACLLANHGQIACGPTLKKALGVADGVEELADQYLSALSVGAPDILGDAEMAEILRKFKNYGKQPDEMDASHGAAFDMPVRRD